MIETTLLKQKLPFRFSRTPLPHKANAFTQPSNSVAFEITRGEKVTHWVCWSKLQTPNHKPKFSHHACRKFIERTPSIVASNSELCLLSAADIGLLAAFPADLVGADPFALDRPGAEALVVGIVAGEVAVLDEASAGVAALEVDDFELRERLLVGLSWLLCLGFVAYLTHCGVLWKVGLLEKSGVQRSVPVRMGCCVEGSQHANSLEVCKVIDLG
jgi:hypothetical protein